MQSPAEIAPDSLLRRRVDQVVAVTGLVVTSPLLAVVALAIRATSRGPAVFRQQRVGRGGDCFTIWKFRTMLVDAPLTGGAVSGRHDPRVTPVGRCLRGTRLDELPQLVNLLRGDMTLIGPRPEVPSFVACYSTEERRLLTVRPGIIGPGAVLFARDQSHELDDAEDAEALYVDRHLHAKLALDLAYLRDRRLSRDLALLGAAGAAVTRIPVPDRSRPSAGGRTRNAPAHAPRAFRGRHGPAPRRRPGASRRNASPSVTVIAAQNPASVSVG